MTDLRLYLFGPPRIEQNGQPLNITRRKAKALLAYLAVMPHIHSREALAAMLWPNYDPAEGRADLSRTLSVLNKAIGEDWLETDRETVALNPHLNLWVDVNHFQVLLARCKTHDHPDTGACAECLPPLTEAAALYQADFLSGFSLPDNPEFEEWQFFQIETLRQQLASALDCLGLALRVAGDDEQAIIIARQRLALDPLHETAHRDLMQLYAQAGQHSAALRQYKECARLLQAELGVAPAAETIALYESIKTSRSVPPTPKAETSLAPALPAFLEEAPPHSPPQATMFVARERELTQLDGHLQAALNGQGGIVFVAGEAGRGKSTLLNEFARRAQANHNTLIVAQGNCNAFSGSGDPYLPFRDIMSMMCGSIETRWAAGTITRDHARRLWQLLPHAAQALVEHGPSLLDVFVPGAALVKRIEAYSSNAASLLTRLNELSKHPKIGTAHLEQRQLFEEYSQVLHTLSTHSPLLLLLDDLQWADSASINLLFHLGRRLHGGRILILGAYRASEVALGRPFATAEQSRQHPLDVAITELKRQYGDIQLNLSRFELEEDREFVDALLDTQPNQLGQAFRQALFERTKGHPLFTIELLHDMQERGNLAKNEQGLWVEDQKINWDTLPARAEAVIEGRISRLEEQLRDILTVAAVEGEEFTAQVIANVINIDEWPLLRRLSQELEGRHRLIREREEIETGTRRLFRYQFGHVLFQQYLYQQLSLAERRLLHGQIAQTLESLYTGHTGDITVQLAHHYREAGQPTKAVEYARHAAHRAEAMYAYDQAAEHLHTALALIAPGQQPETRMTVLEQLADIYALLGERPRAIQLYQNALDLWHTLPDADKMTAVRLHRKIGETVVYLTWFADRQRFEATAQASFAASLEMTRDAPPHPETARLLTTISTEAWLTRLPADWDTAEYYARAAVTMAETMDAPVELSLALDNLAAVFGARGLLRERVDVSLRRLELSRDSRFSNPRERAKILQQTGFALVQVGEYMQAMPYLLEAEMLSRQVQALDQEFRALRWQEYCWVRLDQWDKVFEIDAKWRDLEARHSNFAERVGPTCFLIALAASIHALRGNLEQAQTLRNEALSTMIANDGPAEGWERDNRY